MSLFDVVDEVEDAANLAPTASRPTGGGDFDEVCTVCGDAVPEPHTFEACARRLAEHSNANLDTACEAVARVAELEEELAHANAGHSRGASCLKLIRERAQAVARVAELEQLLADRDALDAILTRSAAAEIRCLRDALVEIVRTGTPGVAEIAAAALGRVFP